MARLGLRVSSVVSKIRQLEVNLYHFQNSHGSFYGTYAN